MAQAGRRPKPTHLKVVAGTLKADRRNKAEAKPALAIPVPPPELSADARREWDQISLRLYALGLLTAIDGPVLAAYCQVYGRWLQAERVLAVMAHNDPLTSGLMIKTQSGNVIQNPVVGVANKAMDKMVRYAAELGMSPSARSRVRANLEQQDQAEQFFD